LKVQAAKDDELKERGALDVALVPEKQEDIEMAKKIRYHGQGGLVSLMHDTYRLTTKLSQSTISIHNLSN